MMPPAANTPAVQPVNSSSDGFRLSDATREFLFRVGDTKGLAKNQALPPFQSPPTELVFVNRGWLSLAFGETIVSLLKPGDIFMGPIHPFSAVIGSSPLILTAVTKAEVAVISRQLLTEALSARPDLLFELYSQACARMTDGYIDRCLSQNALPEDRLAAFLWTVGIPQEGGVARVLPPISQAVIASCMGTGREEISRKRQILIQRKELSRNERGEWVLSPNQALQGHPCICSLRNDEPLTRKSRSE